MKAMLEPIMVAASIHVLDSAVHGDATAADWITPSSQGAFMDAMDASREEYASEVNRAWSGK
jgi:hypothetical protein